MMIHRLEFYQRPIECPPMKSGSSNAPTPPPLHPPPFTSHTRPPQWRTSGPHKLLLQHHHDRTPVKVTILNLRLYSHLILSSRTTICSKRNANERPMVRRQDPCHMHLPLNLNERPMVRRQDPCHRYSPLNLRVSV